MGGGMAMQTVSVTGRRLRYTSPLIMGLGVACQWSAILYPRHGSARLALAITGPILVAVGLTVLLSRLYVEGMNKNREAAALVLRSSGRPTDRQC
jgi:hypothetical protein